MLWVLIGLLTLVTLILLLAPLRHRGVPPAPRAAHDLEIYRDQLREVDAQIAQGILSANEAADARLEIERRILRLAVDPGSRGYRKPNASRIMALAVAVFVPAFAILLYREIGRPDLAGAVQGVAEADQEQAVMIEGMVGRLADRLKQTPDDLEGWSRLGTAYAVLERWQASAAAFEQALALEPDHQGNLWHAGIAYYNAGDRARARALWVRLKGQLEPGSEALQAVEQAIAVLNAEETGKP